MFTGHVDLPRLVPIRCTKGVQRQRFLLGQSLLPTGGLLVFVFPCSWLLLCSLDKVIVEPFPTAKRRRRICTHAGKDLRTNATLHTISSLLISSQHATGSTGSAIKPSFGSFCALPHVFTINEQEPLMQCSQRLHPPPTTLWRRHWEDHDHVSMRHMTSGMQITLASYVQGPGESLPK